MLNQGRNDPVLMSNEDLGQMLSSARANTADALGALIGSNVDGQPVMTGDEYLVFTCAHLTCAVPLSDLIEVLRPVPATVALPRSPDWMAGIFPHRSRFIALVDPMPLLTMPDTERSSETPTSISEDGLPQTSHVQRPVGPSLSAGALLIGIGEQSVAWVVNSVGDIIRLTPEAVHAFADESHQILNPRYAVGEFTLDDAHLSCVVLQSQVLLEDQLAQISESSTQNE